MQKPPPETTDEARGQCGGHCWRNSEESAEGIGRGVHQWPDGGSVSFEISAFDNFLEEGTSKDRLYGTWRVKYGWRRAVVQHDPVKQLY